MGIVFHSPDKALERRAFALPDPVPPGAIVCDILLSALCGSDLHTLGGRREEPAPLVLGHEIVGRVRTLGAGVTTDSGGSPLQVGDTVTWSIAASCGRCFYCTRGLEQKCEVLHKYGHRCCDDGCGLSGGFAERIYLTPDSAVFRVPEGLAPRTVVPANCALATVIHALDAVDLREGESVLIQGAGLLGMYAAARARSLGAGRVVVADLDRSRLSRATAFGADTVIDVTGHDPSDVADALRRAGLPHGVDVALEVSGAVASVAAGLASLRLGGRYAIAGLVAPGPPLPIHGDTLTRRCLTLVGIHNYRPHHLAQAIAFLDSAQDRFPFDTVVGSVFDLEAVEDAIALARTGRHLRVAVRPGATAAPVPPSTP